MAMTDVRRPLHLAVMIGASTAVYAASLAAVTAFQSSDDRALMQRQAPAEDAVTRLSAGHDRLEASLGKAADTYDRAAGGYDALGSQLAGTEDSLNQLATHVQTISGAARALPGSISLPTVSRTVTRTTTRPATTASTGASGK